MSRASHRTHFAARRIVLARVLSRRCPQCGRGALFRAYARLESACAECGLVFRREQGAQTGSMYVTAAVSEVFAAVLIFVFWWSFDWTPLTFVLVTAPIVLAFCAVLLPFAQAAWVGVEYATDLASHEPWAELRE
jgi:uncharacterized protein (DUF983 family)